MLLVLVEEVLNRLLRLDPNTLRRLGALEGKTIAVRLTAAPQPIEVYALPWEAGLRLRRHVAGQPDVTIAGSVPFFARLLYTRAASAGVPAGELQISGDIELGQRFKEILDRVDIDWEEEASRYVGDVVAHALGNGVRELRGWTGETAATIARDISEYLQEESRILAKRERVSRFLAQVDALRVDVDRVGLRVQRLAGKF